MAGSNEDKTQKEEHFCVECSYLGMGVKRNGDEYYYCMCEEGRGTTDEYREACDHFLNMASDI